MHEIWSFLVEFLFGTIILKMIIAHGIADLILRGFKWAVIRSRRQAVLWVHYRDRAMKRGHGLDHAICREGLCHFLNREPKAKDA